MTEEDIEMIKHFALYKGDITRWCDWTPEKRAEVQAEYPEVVAALDAIRIAERTLIAVINNMTPF